MAMFSIVLVHRSTNPRRRCQSLSLVVGLAPFKLGSRLPAWLGVQEVAGTGQQVAPM